MRRNKCKGPAPCQKQLNATEAACLDETVNNAMRWLTQVASRDAAAFQDAGGAASGGAAIVEVASITPAAAPALISTAQASNATAEAVSTSSDVTQHAIRKRPSSGIRSATKKRKNIIRSTAVDAADAC